MTTRARKVHSRSAIFGMHGALQHHLVLPPYNVYYNIISLTPIVGYFYRTDMLPKSTDNVHKLGFMVHSDKIYCVVRGCKSKEYDYG